MGTRSPTSTRRMSCCQRRWIVKECSGYLSEWQAGFRPQRGCRDNILLLRVLIDTVLKRNKSVCITFIDYSAAFDSVSHKFLDKSLAAAGASRKTRAMFRAIYRAAEGTARVRGLNGRTIYTMRMLNGINSRLLHRITGKTYKEEASEGTRTFDLVRWIRARRAQ